MKLAKGIGTMMVVAGLLTFMCVPAFAHGHQSGCGYYRTASQYSLCNVENCNAAGYHQHDGVTYCGHYTGDAHGCNLSSNGHHSNHH